MTFRQLTQYILLIWIITIGWADGQCTFPESLRGVWQSSNKGALNFTDTTILEYPLPVTVTTRQVDLVCREQLGTKYLLRSSSSFVLFSYNFYAYVCIDLHPVSPYKFWFHSGNNVDSSTLQAASYSFSPTENISSACNRAEPYDVSNFNTLVLESAFEDGLIEATCPTDLLHTFANGTITSSDDTTSCDNVTLDACTERTQMRFTFGASCDSSLTIPADGTSVCLNEKTNSSTGITYVHVWNNDTSLPTDFMRINCYAIEKSGGVVTGTLYPGSCEEGQDTTAVSSPGVKVTYSGITATCQDTVEGGSQLLYILGIALGAALLIILIIVLVCVIKRCRCRCCCCKRREDVEASKSSLNDSDTESETSHEDDRRVTNLSPTPSVVLVKEELNERKRRKKEKAKNEAKQDYKSITKDETIEDGVRKPNLGLAGDKGDTSRTARKKKDEHDKQTSENDNDEGIDTLSDSNTIEQDVVSDSSVSQKGICLFPWKRKGNRTDEDERETFSEEKDSKTNMQSEDSRSAKGTPPLGKQMSSEKRTHYTKDPGVQDDKDTDNNTQSENNNSKSLKIVRGTINTDVDRNNKRGKAASTSKEKNSDMKIDSMGSKPRTLPDSGGGSTDSVEKDGKPVPTGVAVTRRANQDQDSKHNLDKKTKHTRRTDDKKEENTSSKDRSQTEDDVIMNEIKTHDKLNEKEKRNVCFFPCFPKKEKIKIVDEAGETVDPQGQEDIRTGDNGDEKGTDIKGLGNRSKLVRNKEIENNNKADQKTKQVKSKNKKQTSNMVNGVSSIKNGKVGDSTSSDKISLQTLDKTDDKRKSFRDNQKLQIEAPVQEGDEPGVEIGKPRRLLPLPPKGKRANKDNTKDSKPPVDRKIKNKKDGIPDKPKANGKRFTNRINVTPVSDSDSIVTPSNIEADIFVPKKARKVKLPLFNPLELFNRPDKVELLYEVEPRPMSCRVLFRPSML